MRFGTAEAGPGELATGRIALGHFADAPMESPVMLAVGAKPGPRLLVQCLIHGPEVVGPIAAARFLRALDLSALAGSVAALLVANPPGFRAYNRLTPQDGQNLNRVFPGSAAGTVTEQLADRLMAIYRAHADVLVDLHSGGELTITAFYVIHAVGQGPAFDESRRLAQSVGSRFQWGSDEPWLEGAAFANATRRLGLPAIIVESGGGARVTDDDLSNMATALDGVTRALGIRPGPPPVARDIRLGGGAVHVKATRGGFWQPAVAPGDDMVAGQEMGRIIDVFSDTAEVVPCPHARAWVGSIRRPHMAVHAGDQVVEAVERRDP
jgi:hypothetical protein